MSDLPQRLRLNATIPLVMKAADRIEALEARLDRAVTRGLDQVERIATLEAALQRIVEGHPEFLAHHLQAIARAALEQNK